jgi:uncharacterized protein
VVQTPAAAPAFTVAVFGDGFAFDAARGLNEGSDPAARLGVLDATDDNTGLAGTDVPDWAKTIDDAAKDAGHLDAAVLMLGADDLHPMPDGKGGQVDFGSPGWHAIYADRIRRTAALFRDKKLPLIWVGLPIVRDPAQAARFAELNALLRENAPAEGAVFVDSWGAFADDAGHYATSGPDVDGQTAKLRRDDGRRFTLTGAIKLASFIQPELKRVRDRAEASAKLTAIVNADSNVFDQALAIDVNAQIRREAGLPPVTPAAAQKDGPVVALTAAPMAIDGRLATPDIPVSLSAQAEAVLSTGLPPPARAGRADDFSWPRP